MKSCFGIFLFCFSSFSGFLAHAEQKETNQSIYNTSLSKQEVDAYLTGRSLGCNKVAELNHFPSPKRVLELKDQLSLSTAQKNRTTVLYKKMRKYAIKTGREIVQKEEQLNQLFQQDTVDMNQVKTLVAEIASLQGELRFIHLNAHVTQKDFLSDSQITNYFDSKDVETQTIFAFDNNSE